MDPTWTRVLLILLLCQKVTSADVKAEEGKEAMISCKPEKGTMVIWFRALDKSGMEFIASVSSTGQLKTSRPNFNNKFRFQTTDSQTLILKSFNKNNDSGVYSCGSLVNGNKLLFGEVTRLKLDEATKKVTKAPPVRPTTQTSTPTKTCLCKDKNKTGPSMFCAPIILGPLAGGCGLLLLLLIVTTLYCNKMRTRRCPHHHKRKLRMDALEKQMMTNRHV
ncbi:T-cell surface glycoprotein CD8 alpha chain [Kryptolebias marmoratus]|uniref:T-cell surface glycoprotein CD8 alpha chain n=1 Tax=Kryptolebias marmoratus TaxID=37003 RepID=UPI0007F895D5|nr:T-cell surface glycoprotein CD8 alpha chain [Kryptolebias marmoratus]